MLKRFSTFARCASGTFWSTHLAASSGVSRGGGIWWPGLMRVSFTAWCRDALYLAASKFFESSTFEADAITWSAAATREFLSVLLLYRSLVRLIVFSPSPNAKQKAKATVQMRMYIVNFCETLSIIELNQAWSLLADSSALAAASFNALSTSTIVLATTGRPPAAAVAETTSATPSSF